MSGTHTNLLFGSKTGCFACKSHRWGLEPIESFYSYVKLAVMCAQNHRWGLGPIDTWNSGPKCAAWHAKTTDEGWYLETSNSGANHAILHAHNDRLCLGLIETCFSGPKVALLHRKTTHEGWDPWRLVILMLLTLHCRNKTAGEFWDP